MPEAIRSSSCAKRRPAAAPGSLSVFLLFGFFIKFKYSSYASNNWTYSYTSYYLGGNKVEFPILALRDKSNNVAVFIHVPYSKFIVGENEENIKDCEIIDRKYAYIQYSRFYNKFTYSLVSYEYDFVDHVPTGNKITAYLKRSVDLRSEEGPFVEFSINKNSMSDFNGISNVNKCVRRYVESELCEKWYLRPLFALSDILYRNNFKFLFLGPFDFAEDVERFFRKNNDSENTEQ